MIKPGINNLRRLVSAGKGFCRDLVLTDVLMPGMTGIELVQRIRALDPSVGTLLMSGFMPDNLEVPGDVRLLKKPLRAA